MRIGGNFGNNKSRTAAGGVDEGIAMVELTEYEAEVVVDFIEMCLIECIKTDGADSLQWIHTLLNVWRKCVGKYDDDDEKEEEQNVREV